MSYEQLCQTSAVKTRYDKTADDIDERQFKGKHSVEKCNFIDNVCIRIVNFK